MDDLDLIESFKDCVKRFPAKDALIYPANSGFFGAVKYKTISYQDLDAQTNRYAHGLHELGLQPGERVLCMIPPGVEFISLTFAVCKLGAIPVFIDPGMGRRAMLRCIAESESVAMVGNTLAHAFRKMYPAYFKDIKLSINTGATSMTGGISLREINHPNSADFDRLHSNDTDPFLIAFTTGSTGTPKGVVYLQRTMNAQILAIRNNLGLNENEIILEAFIPFSLRDIAMGTTCIMPKMNPTKPSRVNPRHVVSAIQTFKPTYSFGSPAFWNRVVGYCKDRNIQFTSLKRIMLAGAPITPKLIRDLKSILDPDGEVHTPYGATEALPISSITGADILNDTEAKTNIGFGICVGKALTGVEIRIIKIADNPIVEWNSSLALRQNEIGEIVAKGDVVTSSYLKRPDETQLHKIQDGNTVWHRMGDVGYLDDQQRLWYCGRKNDRVIMNDRVLFSIPCEAIFNLHEDVKRSALIGVGPKGNQRPVIVVEPHEGKMPQSDESRKVFIERLLSIARENDVTKCVEDFLFHSNLPMDYRHNAKILRNELADWAEKRML